jgi:hypothetical protein
VRIVLVVAFCLVGSMARAQEQERKLVDRLLEPNMKLENSQQNKQFTGGGTVTPKSASTRSFYVSNRELTKTFADTREAGTRSYSSHQFATKAANLPPPPRTQTYATAKARNISAARESFTRYDSRQYAGSRAFVEQGKSQKALHQQDHPLSIDDIRELLNKNK